MVGKQVFGSTRTIGLLAGCFLSVIAIAGLVGQSPEPSLSNSFQPSPSPSIVQTAVRTPSPTPSPGTLNFHQWGSITLFNGLPSDSVRAIAQTLDGIMWFGTDNGLARFDGRRIQTFTFGDSNKNRILALKTAPNGELWIGTAGGAFVYMRDRIQPIEGSDGMGINVIFYDRELYLGTDAGSVLTVAKGEEGPLSATSLFDGPIMAVRGETLPITGLLRNHDGELLASTRGGGIYVVSPGAFSKYLPNPRVLMVNALAKSPDEQLWLGADAGKGTSGIYKIDGQTEERVSASSAIVSTLEANENGVWAGSERYGLFQITTTKPAKNYTFENTSGGLRSNTILSLFTDREGVIWVGTNRGVSRFDRQGPLQQTVSDIPNSNFIRTLFATDEKRAIFAGSNRGLFTLNGDMWNPVPGFNERAIYAIGTDAGGIAVGTSTGVFDSRGKLIIGGDTRGLEAFQGDSYAAIFGKGVVNITNSSQSVIFADESATALLSSKDKLWIGTAGKGLFSFDGQNVKPEVGPDGLKSGTIRKMFESADNALWIAGEHGVFAIKDGQAEQAIACEDVRDVYVDSGDVWAATTTRGLLHARHDDRFGWLVSAVGFEQGLPSDKAFSILPFADHLMIATNRGVVKYFPGSVSPKIAPLLVLSRRMHDLTEINATIDLEYPQNSLIVEVAGQSSRTFPEEFQYAFLLKDAKGNVIDSRFSHESQFTPTNMRAGEYSIEARAFDRDLLTSEPLVVRFSIGRAPFPWTATGLGILLAIALVALIWAIVERRHLAFRNVELAAARFDLANEAERERSRIARDLHDQTLADLRNLMLMSDQPSFDKKELRGEIETVSTEIRRICEDLSPSVLENIGLVAALEFLLSRSAKKHQFSASEDINEQITFPVIVQLHIYRIVQEVLSNIERHSNADIVEMNAEVFENERFRVTIGDNGRPFKPKNGMGRGRGISNIRSRANLINAKISWQEPTAGGNLFSLDISSE
jgi:signal transduction histidine kinase/ligand-binding sensor domain-containing protein